MILCLCVISGEETALVGLFPFFLHRPKGVTENGGRVASVCLRVKIFERKKKGRAAAVRQTVIMQYFLH